MIQTFDNTGNLVNQKYEAEKHIRQHLLIVTNIVASPQVSRWRDAAPVNYHFNKQKGRFINTERKVNSENHLICDRLESIARENRRVRTEEYTPGMRVGRGKCPEKQTNHLY